MQRVDDAEELGKILRIRNRISASQSVLSRKWISDTGVFVMAAENAVHFVDGEDDILADAFRAETSGRLIGVRNDHDITEDHAVIVEPTPGDFDLLGREFIGQFFLLFFVIVTKRIWKLLDSPLLLFPWEFLPSAS